MLHADATTINKQRVPAFLREAPTDSLSELAAAEIPCLALAATKPQIIIEAELRTMPTSDDSSFDDLSLWGDCINYCFWKTTKRPYARAVRPKPNIRLLIELNRAFCFWTSFACFFMYCRNSTELAGVSRPSASCVINSAIVLGLSVFFASCNRSLACCSHLNIGYVVSWKSVYIFM